MKNILSAVILLLSASTCFSQEKQISFTDRTNLAVTNASLNVRTPEEKPAEVLRVSIIGKEFVGFLTGSGKAVRPLDDAALKSLAKKNKSLAAQIKRLDSAYNLTQENTEYYFAGLNSIAYDKFTNCTTEKPCQVKCQAFVVRLNGKKTTENILILRSLELIQ